MLNLCDIKINVWFFLSKLKIVFKIFFSAFTSREFVASSKIINLDFLYNDIQHQKNDTECGIYSLYFIISMMNNINFKDFVKKIKNDEFMEKYRKIFYLDK